MTQSFHQAVVTDVGILKGRDTFFVEEVDLRLYPSTLSIAGLLNGNHASDNRLGGDLIYHVTFESVLALQMIELDSWWGNGAAESVSCFDQVIHSSWIAGLGGKVTAAHQHYVLQTYDDVFAVICKAMRISIATQPS
jgi:hypothetical protein